MNDLKTKPDELLLVTLWRDEIAVHRDEIIDFLLGLGNEMKTLLSGIKPMTSIVRLVVACG
jgi:hypothetical protein